YRRPHGWYYRRWNYGDFLPALFFGQDYWISDYRDFDLPYPPEGTVWVRYGNDALLVDEDTGEIIQVIYGIFYLPPSPPVFSGGGAGEGRREGAMPPPPLRGSPPP